MQATQVDFPQAVSKSENGQIEGLRHLCKKDGSYERFANIGSSLVKCLGFLVSFWKDLDMITEMW